MKTRIWSPRGVACILLFAVVLILGFAYLTPGHRLRSASAEGAAPSGSYGFILTSDGVVGLMNFDGAGNFTGSFTSTESSGAINTGTVAGTYTTKGDGTGSMTLAITAADGSSRGSVTLAMAITDGGSGLYLL